jgi:hypothetical protein
MPDFATESVAERRSRGVTLDEALEVDAQATGQARTSQ